MCLGECYFKESKMPNCAICNCKNTSKLVGRTSGNVSYHRFPRDPNVKEKWIDATGNKNWFPSKYSTICSIHFKEDDYLTPTKKRVLFDEAYPTINICKTIKSEEDETIQQRCTSQIVTPFEDTPQIRRYKKMIRNKNLKIKRLQEQNRRKLKIIISLKATIESLKKKAKNMEQAEYIIVVTNELNIDEKLK